MKKIRIPNTEIQELIAGEIQEYPKYATQILNLANQNAQGTRPKAVGQLSEMIQEFEGNKLEDWEKFYKGEQPDAIEAAAKKVYSMVQNLQQAIEQIDYEMVRKWIEELIIVKTFTGLKFQEAILKKVADEKEVTYRLATPEEESQGIDGFIGYQAISIKPMSYKAKQGLVEEIKVEMIFYEKKKSGLVVYYDF